MALENACELYEQFPFDEDLKLRCGVTMFFTKGLVDLVYHNLFWDFVSTIYR